MSAKLIEEAMKEDLNEKLYCIECGKKLKYYGTKRCRRCWKLYSKKGYQVIDISGDKNVNWKGDDAGYFAIHNWVRRNKPKQPCEFCGSKKNLQLANISGEYKRDVDDYMWLCAKCHTYYDGTVNNLTHVNKQLKKCKEVKLKTEKCHKKH